MPLVEYLQEKLSLEKEILLNFICTHNSRRSHLGQVWAQTMASYYGIPSILCFSGGTEATAVYPMVIEVLKEAGFICEKDEEKDNPKYTISFGKETPKIIGFSKKYDDAFNPSENFGAVMTCSQADEACPIVFGAEKRIAITYEDPKIADGTPNEKSHYLERSIQIATEMKYVFSKISL